MLLLRHGGMLAVMTANTAARAAPGRLRRFLAGARLRNWVIDTRASGLIVDDRQRVIQALVQLAQNATEHTGDDATVVIGSTVGDGSARFWVSDDGPGVAAEDRRRIFARFARGSSTPRQSNGSGLGPATVQAIAEAHGGELAPGSEPEGGATFTLTLPADPVEPVAPASLEAAQLR